MVEFRGRRRGAGFRGAAILVLVGLAAAASLAAAAELTRARIVIATPGKKEGGQPTQVVFEHQGHAARDSCAVCHPQIRESEGDPANTINNVHAVCLSCHSKTGKASKVRGCACHAVR